MVEIKWKYGRNSVEIRLSREVYINLYRKAYFNIISLN